MSTIERVMQMQQQGMSDGDIITSLRNEGISPKEVSDSLSQAKIKMAVNQESPSEYQESYQAPSPNSQSSQSTSQPTQTTTQQYAPTPTPEQQYQQPYPQEQYQQYAPEQQQYTQYPDQSQQQFSYDQGQMSAETISDIVDRVVIEKLKETHQKIKSLTDFKTKTEESLIDIKERLKRIESTIDNLQKSIISKVGEFGESTTMIHKDLENLHGTVSKLMNPLMDNYNELRKITSAK